MSGMSDSLTEQPNPTEKPEEAMERMVGELMQGVGRFGKFEGTVGLGAVLTFAHRFASTMITLSPTKESKKENTEKIAGALRLMAAQLEFQLVEEGKQVIH